MEGEDMVETVTFAKKSPTVSVYKLNKLYE